MSALFSRAFDVSRLGALSRAGTILGLSAHDIPDLPLPRADVDLPAPLVLPSMPAIIRPRARAVDEIRELALHVHRCREDLTSWDRSLVRELIRWRQEPSAWEADEVAVLAERLFWQARDQVDPLQSGQRL